MLETTLYSVITRQREGQMRTTAAIVSLGNVPLALFIAACECASRLANR